MRVIINATVLTTRRNGPTPRHASQHVPAAFPSGGAYRYIVLPRRKFASPDAPPFGPYVLSPQRRMGSASLRTFQKSYHVLRIFPRPRVTSLPGYDARRVPRRSLALQSRGRGSSRGIQRRHSPGAQTQNGLWIARRSHLGAFVFPPKLFARLVTLAHPRRNSSSLSARPSRRTCPYTTSTHLGAFCGPFATRTCRTLRRRPRSGATVRWRHCAHIARRMAYVCSRFSTWRKCSRRLSSPATWSGTSQNTSVGDANGILTWGRSSHMAHTYDKVIEELQAR